MVLVITFVAFEGMAVATALPVVLQHLGDVRLYGWTFTAFMLTQLVGALFAGSAVDRIGLAVPLLVAVLLFAGGLLVGGAAPSMPVLVGARAVQGFGAGVVGVVVNVAIGRGYPEAARPRIYAVLSSAWVLPSVVGPLVAGVVAQDVSWRWVFLGVVPIVLAAGALALAPLRRLDRIHPRRGTGGTGSSAGTGGSGATGARGRVLGGFGIALGTGLVITGLGTHPQGLGLLLAGLGLLVGIPSFRRILPTPTGKGPLVSVLAVSGLATLAFFGTEAFLPLTLTAVHHRNPVAAGLVLTAASLSWTAGAWGQARWGNRVGSRGVLCAGLALLVVGIAGAASLTWAQNPVWVAWVAWAVAGFGLGLAYPTATLVVLRVAENDTQGAAVAAQQVCFTLGIAVGAGIGGLSLAWSVARGHGPALGLRAFDAAAMVIALLGVLVSSATRIPPPERPG
jgi:MFS family permease